MTRHVFTIRLLSSLLLTLLAGCQSKSPEQQFAEIDESMRELVEVRATAIQNRDCAAIEREFGLSDSDEAAQDYPRVMAYLHLNGICVSEDPEKAAAILEKASGDQADPATLAMLGDFYLRGHGVTQDQEEAERLFQRAVLSLVPEVSSFITYDKLDEPGPLSALWGLTRREAMVGFVDPYIGPWLLPAPLLEQRQILEEVIAKGGPEVRTIARHLHDGSGGYPQAPVLAYEWVVAAAYSLNYEPAFFELFLWSREFPDCSEDSDTFPCHDSKMANTQLIRAAEAGVKDAVALVTACLDTSPPFEGKDLAVYYWQLKSQSLGYPLPGESLVEAGETLSEAERRVAADWVHNGDGYAFVKLYDADCYR